MIYISGPGHGGPASCGNTYLEGTYTEIYPNISQDEAGLQELFTQFFISRRNSQPCFAGMSRVDPRRRASWGIRISHAFGAVFDNPDLIVAVRRRGWRSRDRAAGHGLAFQ